MGKKLLQWLTDREGCGELFLRGVRLVVTPADEP